MPPKKNFFTPPNSIFNIGLSCHQIAVLSYLIRCGPKCFPSHSTIAKHAGMGLTKAKEVLNQLRDLKLISWIQGQKSNHYKVHFEQIEELRTQANEIGSCDTEEVSDTDQIPIAKPSQDVTSATHIMSGAEDLLSDIGLQIGDSTNGL